MSHADRHAPMPAEEMPLLRAPAAETAELIEMIIGNSMGPGGVTVAVSAANEQRRRAHRIGRGLP